MAAMREADVQLLKRVVLAVVIILAAVIFLPPDWVPGGLKNWVGRISVHSYDSNDGPPLGPLANTVWPESSSNTVKDHAILIFLITYSRYFYD